ncbi:MAG: formylglycine-generating enzyme family protein [Anaerolineae bacterium]|nr:formylglycine-generating enzyme family protein [Anaerolineae bacterium]
MSVGHHALRSFLTIIFLLGVFLSSCRPDQPLSSTPVPSATYSLSSTSVSTLTDGEQAYQVAKAGITQNADWIPYTDVINGVEMALVPAGCFMMGSTGEQLEAIFQICKADSETGECDSTAFEDEQPVHQVCFEQPFWVDVTEVTNGQFEEWNGQAAKSSRWTDADHPRDNVTWAEAVAFCRQRGARLLTEAEWEYVARGPDGLVYPWGNTFISHHLIYSANSGRQTWASGSKPDGASWVGALDLGGNVWEWVNDWYGSYLSEPQVDPVGPDNGMYRVLRGGAWNRDIGRVRAANRGKADPYIDNDSYGFRCGSDELVDISPISVSTPLHVERAGDILAPARAGVTRNSDWTPYIENIDGVEMALVPAGCFMMGSDNGENNEQPARQVCFNDPFRIDVTEVTNAQYGSSGKWPGDSLPRENVTWEQADAFCHRRGLRLPTEAEWEYAARGPDGLIYPWGNEFDADNVVYIGNSGNRTWDVGSKPSGVSWVGAIDLSGNVWEWVNDWYGLYLSEPQINPTGPDQGAYYVLRGGSWYGSERYVRAAVRYGEQSDRVIGDLVGFRCSGPISATP